MNHFPLSPSYPIKPVPGRLRNALLHPVIVRSRVAISVRGGFLHNPPLQTPPRAPDGRSRGIPVCRDSCSTRRSAGRKKMTSFCSHIPEGFFLSLPCRSKAPRCCARHHLPTARGCLVLPPAQELSQAGRAATSLPWIITAERQSRHISARQLHSWVQSLQPLCSLITSKRSRLSPQQSAVRACGSSPNLS